MRPGNLPMPTDNDFSRFEQRLLDTISNQLTQRRHRHRSVLAASVVLVLAGGGGTAWVTLATPELQTLSAYCYAEASTDSEFTQVGSPTDQIAQDGAVSTLAPVADPAAAALSNCAAVWAIDLFGTGTHGEYEQRSDPGTSSRSPDPTSAPSSGPALTPLPAPPPAVVPTPRLQECLRPDGVYAVFPVPVGSANADDPDAFCATVGLQPPPAG